MLRCRHNHPGVFVDAEFAPTLYAPSGPIGVTLLALSNGWRTFDLITAHFSTGQANLSDHLIIPTMASSRQPEAQACKCPALDRPGDINFPPRCGRIPFTAVVESRAPSHGSCIGRPGQGNGKQIPASGQACRPRVRLPGIPWDWLASLSGRCRELLQVAKIKRSGSREGQQLHGIPFPSSATLADLTALFPPRLDRAVCSFPPFFFNSSTTAIFVLLEALLHRTHGSSARTCRRSGDQRPGRFGRYGACRLHVAPRPHMVITRR